jgi:hypothetical protein
MIKAFKEAQFTVENEEEIIQHFVESNIQEREDDLIEVNQTFDLPQSDQSFLPETPFSHESGSESIHASERAAEPEDPTEDQLQEEEDLYLREEQELTEIIDGLLTVPLSKRKIKRISCLSHSLQLVLNSFDKFRNQTGVNRVRGLRRRTDRLEKKPLVPK